MGRAARNGLVSPLRGLALLEYRVRSTLLARWRTKGLKRSRARPSARALSPDGIVRDKTGRRRRPELTASHMRKLSINNINPRSRARPH